MSEFETGPSEEQKPAGVSILPDEPQAEEAAPRDPQAVDPNEVLNEILQGLSGFQAVLGMFDARIGQLEKLTGYLLQKDPQFMANLQAAEVKANEAKAAVVPSDAVVASDGQAKA